MVFWLILAVAAFFQAMLVGGLLVPWARAEAGRLGLIDRPTLARKHHTVPTPRSGGLAIFAAFWGCFWINLTLAGLVVPYLPGVPEVVRVLAGNVAMKLPQIAGLFAGCSMIFVLGVLDDRFNLPAPVRLVVQVLACVPLIMSGIVLKLFLPEVVAWPLTVLWLVLLTNSMNFLDNMNGLSSGVAALVALLGAVISLLSREYFVLVLFAMLAGATVAFWRVNFPNGKIFLGDSGSTHLGFLLAALMILSTYYQEGVPTRLPILIPLVLMGVPLFDTLSVMWIRWRAGRPLMVGDTNHLSHRLVSLGMSRTEAVVFIYGAVVVLGMLALALRRLDEVHGVFILAAIVLIFLLLHRLERVSYRGQAARRSDSR